MTIQAPARQKTLPLDYREALRLSDLVRGEWRVIGCRPRDEEAWIFVTDGLDQKLLGRMRADGRIITTQIQLPDGPWMLAMLPATAP